MNRWAGLFVVICICTIFCGCRTAAHDQDDVRAAIEKRLNARADLNLGAMDREVKQVSVNGDHATAQVEFRVKGGNAKMDIEYTLERQNKQWAVTNSQPMGMDGMQQEQGQIPANGQESGGQKVPQGHPPVN